MINDKAYIEQIENIIKNEADCEYWDDCFSCEYECFVKKILDIINKAKEKKNANSTIITFS